MLRSVHPLFLLRRLVNHRLWQYQRTKPEYLTLYQQSCRHTKVLSFVSQRPIDSFGKRSVLQLAILLSQLQLIHLRRFQRRHLLKNLLLERLVGRSWRQRLMVIHNHMGQKGLVLNIFLSPRMLDRRFQ